MSSEVNPYFQGHSDKVLQTHAWRSLDNSFPILIPHIQSARRILDVGCGPGSITLDAATRSPGAEVVGVDSGSGAIEAARKAAADAGLSRVKFEVADAMHLPFQDDEFDLVFCHQVLSYFPDQPGGIREMRRVCRPGGIVAVRETDDQHWYPNPPELTRAHEVWRANSGKNGFQEYTGRKLKGLAIKAGFAEKDVKASIATWFFVTREEKDFHFRHRVQRVMEEQYVKQVVDQGLASVEDLQKAADAWIRMIDDPEACLFIVHGEIICTKAWIARRKV